MIQELKVSEGQIQNFLFLHLFNRKNQAGKNRFFNITSNCFFFAWESDLICSDHRGKVFEFEIKTSLADFRSDFKSKKQKHQQLLNASNRKKKFLESSSSVPTLFYFIAPEEVPESDVPEYAGLYSFRSFKDSARNIFIEFTLRKKAPALSEHTFQVADFNKMLQSTYFKYWRNRTRKPTFKK